MKYLNIHTKYNNYETINRLMSVQTQFCQPGSSLQTSERSWFVRFLDFRKRDLVLRLLSHSTWPCFSQRRCSVTVSSVTVTAFSSSFSLSYPQTVMVSFKRRPWSWGPSWGTDGNCLLCHYWAQMRVRYWKKTGWNGNLKGEILFRMGWGEKEGPTFFNSG